MKCPHCGKETRAKIAWEDGPPRVGDILLIRSDERIVRMVTEEFCGKFLLSGGRGLRTADDLYRAYDRIVRGPLHVEQKPDGQ